MLNHDTLIRVLSRAACLLPIFLLGCGSSGSGASQVDASGPEAHPDIQTSLEVAGDVFSGAKSDVKGEGDAASGLDAKAEGDMASAKADANVEADAGSGLDGKAEGDMASAKADVAADAPSGVPDVKAGYDLPGDKAAVTEAGTADTGEQCACAGGSPAAMSWTCFCSIENCGRKIDDFVDAADGGRSLRNQTVLLSEYASCNLVLIKHRTYSDYVPPSEYVFDRTTGKLMGAKVQLDDRQHLCPFPSADGGSSWVFSYQAGSYPIPATCQRSSCLGTASACAVAGDAG